MHELREIPQRCVRPKPVEREVAEAASRASKGGRAWRSADSHADSWHTISPKISAINSARCMVGMAKAAETGQTVLRDVKCTNPGPGTSLPPSHVGYPTELLGCTRNMEESVLVHAYDDAG
jgi:hypothetical protein